MPTPVVEFPASRRPPAAAQGLSPCLGRIVGRGPEGQLLVDYEGNALGPLAARCLAGAAAADAYGAEVLLVFERSDPALPVVVGALAPPTVEAARMVELPAVRRPPKECVIDGERLVLDARKEIVLRCGQGSITLRADGRIILRGREIVSRASESNRIKGATVSIN